jgi:hypothetical protein
MRAGEAILTALVVAARTRRTLFHKPRRLRFLLKLNKSRNASAGKRLPGDAQRAGFADHQKNCSRRAASLIFAAHKT